MAALILEINTRGLHQYHRLESETTTIGRALDNDIILSDPTVAPHHVRIIRYGDNSVEIINLAEVNPTRVNAHRIDSVVTENLPLSLALGRVHAQLLSRDFAVAATRALAGNGRRSHLFGHAIWAFALVLACLVVGGLEFYQNADSSYKWSELFKYVLRETVLTIGIFVVALSLLERLLVHRWDVHQLVTAVSLAYLGYQTLSLVAGGLDYLFSAQWPTTLFHFGWYLGLIPSAITLYLIHISHLKPRRSLLLALFITSPIALPAILQSAQLQMLLDDFSTTAQYQKSLSGFNLHLKKTVAIEHFVAQAQELEAGEFAD